LKTFWIGKYGTSKKEKKETRQIYVCSGNICSSGVCILPGLLSRISNWQYDVNET